MEDRGMSVFNVLTLFGGLAMFLFGMELMGQGLESASGGKLEKILENLTSNLIKAVLLGIVVTGVIQSSSATTVMVVGFVNSGIMTLSRAVGVIMGANIGTTVTSWILSLAGIESDSFFMQLLKPSHLLPDTGCDRHGNDHVFQTGEEKGYWKYPDWLYYFDVWYGNHVRRSKTAGRRTGVYQHSFDFLQPGAGSSCRCRADCGDPEFQCFCWYPAGTVYDRSSSL